MRDHGTRACYVLDRCRCEPCREANREYAREHARRSAPAYVDASRAREHLADLSRQGVGLKTVAKLTGLSHGGLSKLVYGSPGRPPSARIRPETERTILGLLAHNVANATHVDSGPTLRTIDELIARGWTRSAIAQSVVGPHARQLQIGKHGRPVERRHAHAIAALLDEPVPARVDRWGNVTQPVPPPASVQVLNDATFRKQRDRARQRGENPDLIEPDGHVIEQFVAFATTGQEWRQRAACGRPDVQPRIFFAAPTDVQSIAAARAVCARCQVIDDCRRFADFSGSVGVWAGEYRDERELVFA